MATTPNTISPLPSRTDGLGIFPSGDSLSRNSVYSYGHTHSSTCTVLSFAQQFHQEKIPSPTGLTRTTTIRTNLKEIQKSPLPHRFNLVPSSKRRVPEQPSKIPRSSTQWRWKRGQEDVESGYSTRSPSLYAASPDPQSTRFAEERNEEKRTILEDLLSDALDSPVFDCIATFSPPCTPSPQTQTVSPPSFTLVQDHPNHKSRPYSTTPDSFRELQMSMDLQPSTNSDRKLLPAFSSPLLTPPVASPRDGAQFCEDVIPALPATAQDVFNTRHELDTPQPTSVHPLSSKRPKSRRTTSSASSSSRDFFICGGLDTSGSTYSQTSLHSSLGATAGNQLQATSRRATDGSFASFTSSDSRRRKFAVRRQAIYAEYGFKLAFPESDSSSSIRHTHIPTSSSRDFAEPGSSRAASAHMGPRSVWSASTSAASIRSQLQHDMDADPADDDDPRYSEHLDLPYPSTLSLANLSNAERFSVQDAFLSSSRNPLLDDYADLMTSTPPAKPRPQAQHSASMNRRPPLASLLEVEAPPTNPGERLTTDAGIYSCGFEWQPWPPLRLAGIDPESGCAIIRPSSSTLERAQMFAKWQDDPGHHPIVQQLLNAVDLAIREWTRGLFVINEYV